MCLNERHSAVSVPVIRPYRDDFTLSIRRLKPPLDWRMQNCMPVIGLQAEFVDDWVAENILEARPAALTQLYIVVVTQQLREAAGGPLRRFRERVLPGQHFAGRSRPSPRAPAGGMSMRPAPAARL